MIWTWIAIGFLVSVGAALVYGHWLRWARRTQTVDIDQVSEEWLREHVGRRDEWRN